MLVDRRDTLTVDDVIPVGDAFDYVVAGQRQALDAQAAALFRSANTLYREKLRPLLLRQARPDRATSGRATPTVPAGFRADDRLAKTLLLSAVAPNVPGAEGAHRGAAGLAQPRLDRVARCRATRRRIVLAKVREWARDVPEIHVDGDAAQPDHPGAALRRRLRVDRRAAPRARTTRAAAASCSRTWCATASASQLGDAGHPRRARRTTVIWRGSRREVDIVFGNVRDRRVALRRPLPRPAAAPGASSSTTRSTSRATPRAEDLQRLDDLLAGGFQARTRSSGCRTSSPRSGSRELRRLVDPELAARRHRRPVDRARRPPVARPTGRRPGHPGVPAHDAAGGAAPRDPGGLRRRRADRPATLLDDAAHDRVLIVARPRLRPRRPVGADLGRRLRQPRATRRSTRTYPGHPRFEPGDVEVSAA